jgi:calcineurin-like phosphoesterase family protein
MNKKIYFTSDLHIGHDIVIKLSKRPFRDVHHMHQVLINNYNSTVGTQDICYFLGDVGFTNSDTIKSVIDQLYGTKVLIRGNHDNKGHQFYHKCGFDVVLNSASIMVAKNVVTMSHCPLYGVYREDMTMMDRIDKIENWHGETKNYKKGFSLPNFGQFHLHGHIHSPNGGKSTKTLGKQYDVGVDANKYTPVSKSVIESWIAKYDRP